MFTSVNLLQVGLTDTDPQAWQGASYRVNRIHLPIRGMANYRDVNGMRRLQVGSAYLLINGFTQDLSMIDGHPYYHLFFDFQTNPPLHSHEALEISSESDCYVHSLLRAAQHLLNQNTLIIQRFAYTLPSCSPAFEEAEQLLRALLMHLDHRYNIPVVENRKIDAAIRYIREHFNEQVQNEDIAAALHLDKRYLIRLFTRYMEMPPYQYLTQCRIEHARDMLLNGRAIKEVAIVCGYQSETAFRIAFKRVMGCTPKAMLKQTTETTDISPIPKEE